MGRYKTWAYKISSWKYLSEDLSCQFFLEHKLPHFVTESKLLCLPHNNRPVNPRGEVLRHGREFNRGPADREEGRLAPQDHHLIGVWIPGSFPDQRERSNEELKSKGARERKRQ